ncbi:MAG: TolC family protein [Candidatus Omnitrophica bacterium]|nr:TolC family protein [Candidatus Omnitrophota bacterium]
MAQGKNFSICLIFVAIFFMADTVSASGDSPEARTITISEGIRLVAKDSRLLKISFVDNDMAFADSLIARSALLPQLNVSLKQSFLKFQPASKLNDSNLPTAQRESLSYGFLVYQTLFDFGKTIANYRAAKETFQAQKSATESVKKLAILEFITSYFDLLESEKMIKVAEKEMESLIAYLNDVKHLVEQGAAIKNDFLPAQVKLADSRKRLIVARNARNNLAARLNNILALPIREKIAVKDVTMNIPVIPEFEDAWRTAQEQRPEIAVISDKLKAVDFSVKAKKANSYPTIYAQGGYAYTENKFQTHQDNLNINLGANIDLFDGGLTQAEVYKERSIQRGLKEQGLKLAEDIKLEIEDSYLGLKDAKEKTLVAKDALRQAAENVRVMRAKYADGAATPTDVLEAIVLETSAQTNYYNAEYEIKRNYTKLLYSMGIDLSLVYDTMGQNENESQGK